LRYAYLDESRTPTQVGVSHSFLAADQHVSRAIELHAKRLRIIKSKIVTEEVIEAK